MKRRMDIEALLRWAYRDELPKAQEVSSFAPPGFGHAWGGLERYGELLTVIDAPENRWGVVPDLTATTEPHPDALAVGAAVEALGRLEIDLPADWNPLADLGDLGALGQAAVARGVAALFTAEPDGRRRLRTGPGLLVQRHAILGGAPDWVAEMPVVRTERAANGRPRWFRRTVVHTEAGPIEVEVDGMDPKRRIPHPDAYQKPYLDPDPAEAVVDRGHYEVWRAALEILAEDLSAALDAFTVVPSPRPLRPWETGDLAPIRVFRTAAGAPDPAWAWNAIRGLHAAPAQKERKRQKSAPAPALGT